MYLYEVYKQTKNRNKTVSNLSLGTRLPVLPKRLGRKRFCDATGPLPGGVSSHYLCFALFKKCVVFFQRSRVWAGSQGLKRTNRKVEYTQRQRLLRI